MSGKIKYNGKHSHSKPQRNSKSKNKKYYFANQKRGQGEWKRPDVPKELHGIKCQEVTYKIPGRKGRKSKRNTFNREICPAFLNMLTEKHSEDLKINGITDEQIKAMKEGIVPNGYNVHHILPLHGGGQNVFENLCLMPIKEHDELHEKIIDPQIEGMNGKEYRKIWLPIPDSPVFVSQEKRKQAEKNKATQIALDKNLKSR